MEKNNNQIENNNETKNNETKKTLQHPWAALLVLVVIVFIILFATGVFSPNSNDGLCDICRKPKEYDLYGEEYCKKHFDDALNHYLK